MFNFFKKNKFNSKSEKIRLIERIEKIQTRCEVNHLHKVTYQLDKIVDKLDDEYLNIVKEQVEAIDKCLTTIEKYKEKVYESLLLNKCNHINACIDSIEVSKDISNVSMSNEDKLFTMLGRLSNLDDNIKAIDSKMDEALGNNQNLWDMLNAQRTSLKNEKLVLTKNYKTLLKNQNNIALAKLAMEARIDAEEIEKQSGFVDIQEFNENSNYTTNVANEVDDTSDQMSETFAKNFGAETSDFAYEKALEAKIGSSVGISLEQFETKNEP